MTVCMRFNRKYKFKRMLLDASGSDACDAGGCRRQKRICFQHVRRTTPRGCHVKPCRHLIG